MKKVFLCLAFVLFSSLLFAQWSTDHAVNNLVGGIPGDDVIPKVVSTINGSTYITWFSYEADNYNVRMQLYNAEGVPQWAAGGLLVSSHPSMTWLTDYNLSLDKENCAIVGFQDIRNGNNNIHVYKISESGQFLWGSNGLSLSNNIGFEPYPVIQNLTDNSTVFAWQSQDSTGQGIIRLQKISGDSTRAWGQWGIVYKSTNPDQDYIYPSLVPSDNNSVILIFHKQTGSFTAPKYIYAQKFSADGTPLWNPDIAIYDGAGVPIIPSITVESDSANGAVVCWHDTRQGMGMFNVYVQRIDMNGNVLFASGGQVVTTTPGYIQMDPSMDYKPSTQEVYTFFNVEDINQSQWGLAGQKMDATGQLMWGNNMLNLLPVSSTEIENVKVRRAQNEVLVTFNMYSFGSSMEAEIKALMVDPLGNLVWSPGISMVCSVQSDKVHQVTGNYAAHQWVLAWEDGRNGNPDVYAQNILINGELGPYPVGLSPEPVREGAWVAVYPNPVSDQMTLSVNGCLGKKVLVGLYNVLGEKVETLFNGVVSSEHQVITRRVDGLKTGFYLVEFEGDVKINPLQVIVR